MATAPQQKQRARRLRRLGRWLVLILACALAWPLWEESWTSVFLPALSPYVGVLSVLAAGSVSVVTILAVPVALLALVFPRWFCRHACPTGLLQELVESLRPSASKRWLRFPMIGKWLVLLTLGGACLGYPFFLWLDPLAIFNGFLNAWHQAATIASLWAGLGLPVLLLVSLFFPRLWCHRLCPLGATQELLALPRRWLLPSTRCDSGAGRGLLSANKLAQARRYFLTACFGAAGAFVLRKVRGPLPGPLRPPGSIDEGYFPGVCIRCGNCIKVCPSNIIEPDLGCSGVSGLLTPVLRFDLDYCREDCYRCNRVCPSGAITRLSQSEKRAAVIGPAEVNLETCLLANGRECTACIRRCPYDALIIRSVDDGFSNEPLVDLRKCTGCGACESVCPVRPTRSIRVTARPGTLLGDL